MALGGVWLASYFVAYDRDASVEQIVEFGKNFVILLVVVYSLNSRASWKQVIWFIILSTTFLATLGAYQVITGNYDQTFWQLAVVTPDVTQMRLSGSVGDPNFHGQILAAVLPLAIYRILDDKNPFLRIFAAGAAFLLVFAILNTYSRGAFLAMVVTLTLIAIERRIRFSLVILILVTTVVMMQFLPEGYTQRLETLSIFTSDEATVHSEGSFRGRTSEMLSARAMFSDHPLLGVGTGNYEANYQEYAGRLGLEQRTENRQAHSLYLEIAAETGILGILTFVGLFVALLIGFSRARRKVQRLDKDSDWPTWIMSLQMAITSYLVSSIFLHGDFIRFLFFLVALGAAAIHLSDRLEERKHRQLSETGLSN
jgi:O-antigen ligase